MEKVKDLEPHTECAFSIKTAIKMRALMKEKLRVGEHICGGFSIICHWFAEKHYMV
jgi:hypothetical protein